MTLQDGVTLIQSSNNNILSLPLGIWNGLSIMDIVIFLIFLSIVGWFVARLIKGQAHNEIAVQNEGSDFMWASMDSEPSFADIADTFNSPEQGNQFQTTFSDGVTSWDNQPRNLDPSGENFDDYE